MCQLVDCSGKVATKALFIQHAFSSTISTMLSQYNIGKELGDRKNET